MADIPPPPPGFTLDNANAVSDIPPPPAGFTLDAPPAASAEPDETAGRLAGVAARGIIGGAAGVPGQVLALGNPVGLAGQAAAPISRAIRHSLGWSANEPAPPAAPQQPYTPSLDDFVHPDHWPEAARYFADKVLGTPQPANPLERVVQSSAAAIPSAVFSPETPIAGAISAMAGGAGQQTAAEMGAGPVGQTIAGLAAGSAPSLVNAGAQAAARGIVRGGSEGQSAMQQRLADAAQSGTNLSAGQAGGNPLVQYLEGVSTKLWGGTPLVKNAEGQTANIANHVEDIVANLAGGVTPSPTAAGTAINAGAEVAKQNMKSAETAAFNKLHALVPRDAPVDVSATLAKLDDLAAPTPGAETTTGALVSPKISQLRDNLTADVAANAAKNAPPAPGPNINITQAPQPDVLEAAIAAEKSTGLPYNAVRQLRTVLGNSIDWGFSPADPVTNGALKQVYGTLTGDLTNAASTVGADAAAAAKSANALYAANSERREFLNGIIEKNGGPEAVYQAATNGTKLGATKINGVMSALAPDQQNIVRATVLDRLGRPSGAQDAPFSANTYLTNWTKLDPDAKDALFGTSGNPGQLRGKLDALSNTIGNISRGTRLKNPSGSGEAVGHAAGIAAAFEGLLHALSGHPGALAGTVAGVAANNVMARALTSPKAVGWLAQSTKLPTSGIPNAVNQLTQLGQNDPGSAALAGYLTQPQPVARATGGKVGPSDDDLVEKLMSRWRKAKRETDQSTKPLLKLPDAAVAAALKASSRGI